MSVGNHIDQDAQARTSSQTPSALNALIGVWPIISLYILSYTTAQVKSEQTIAGIAMAVVAGARFSAPPLRQASRITIAIGV